LEAARIFFKIGEVANLLEVKPSVLRFWESSFSMLTPEKGENGQRVYRRTDIETLLLIQALLYDDGYSIEGARKKLRELRRQGQLKEAREACASKRGFRLPVNAEQSPVPVGAQAAGPAVPLEAYGGAIADLIDEVRGLQASLKRAPQSI
jgi:DNA-binding transcriptional MerR regulator